MGNMGIDTSTADEPLYGLYREIEKVRQCYGKVTAEANRLRKNSVYTQYAVETFPIGVDVNTASCQG
jgi:archaellum component FlaC